MAMEIRKIIKMGAAAYIVIPEKMMQTLCWNVGDHVALRYIQGKIILERVPVEGLAKVRAEAVSGD